MIDTSFNLPGWSYAIDQRSGRQYFINLQERTTTWEDPRVKYKQIIVPTIPMQVPSNHDVINRQDGANTQVNAGTSGNAVIQVNAETQKNADTQVNPVTQAETHVKTVQIAFVTNVATNSQDGTALNKITDDVTLIDANPDIIKNHRRKSNGPNPSLLTDRTYTPRGRSPELCKGPEAGLARGTTKCTLSR